MNDGLSSESFNDKFKDKKIIHDMSVEKLSLNREKEPLIESQTFKVISRSGINQMNNLIRSRSRSGTSNAQKNEPKKGQINKKSKNDLVDLKEVKPDLSRKVVERRKRKVKDLIRRGLDPKKKNPRPS